MILKDRWKHFRDCFGASPQNALKNPGCDFYQSGQQLKQHFLSCLSLCHATTDAMRGQ